MSKNRINHNIIEMKWKNNKKTRISVIMHIKHFFVHAVDSFYSSIYQKWFVFSILDDVPPPPPSIFLYIYVMFLFVYRYCGSAVRAFCRICFCFIPFLYAFSWAHFVCTCIPLFVVAIFLSFFHSLHSFCSLLHHKMSNFCNLSMPACVSIFVLQLKYTNTRTCIAWVFYQPFVVGVFTSISSSSALVCNTKKHVNKQRQTWL